MGIILNKTIAYIQCRLLINISSHKFDRSRVTWVTICSRGASAVLLSATFTCHLVARPHYSLAKRLWFVVT